MKLSDLEGKMVRRQDGEKLGRVFEVRIKDGQVVSLVCGAGGFWQSLAASRNGRRVAWSRVRRITGSEISVD